MTIGLVVVIDFMAKLEAAGTGKVVSTTGIRGLSAEELQSAQFNETEIQKMESLAASTADAQRFAASGGLSSNNTAYLKGAK